MHLIHRTLFITLLALLAAAPCSAQQALRVPTVDNQPVLVDGRFAADEWAGALRVPMAAGDTLLLRQSRGHVFIGIRTARPYPTYVDLFLRDGNGRIHNLHASMQTGERLLADTLWTDGRPATRWGNEEGWIANESKRRPEAPRQSSSPGTLEDYFPIGGREFHVLRSRFPGAEWALRVEVRDMSGAGAPDVVFPARSARMQPSTWAVLRLGEMPRATR